MALRMRFVLSQPGLSNTARNATPALLCRDVKRCTYPPLKAGPCLLAPRRKLVWVGVPAHTARR